MQVMKAKELKSGLFAYLPVFTRMQFEGRDYQGPIMVEANPDVEGNVLVHYPGGTWETPGEYELQVLERPRFSSTRVFNSDAVTLLCHCSDLLIQAGWPTVAREQFLEHAQKGGIEHLLHTIHDVFEVQK
jgi:hypothetical protein